MASITVIFAELAEPASMEIHLTDHNQLMRAVQILGKKRHSSRCVEDEVPHYDNDAVTLGVDFKDLTGVEDFADDVFEELGKAGIKCDEVTISGINAENFKYLPDKLGATVEYA